MSKRYSPVDEKSSKPLFVKLTPSMTRKEKVLSLCRAEQATVVFIGSPLPRALRITEVNVDVCRQAKPSMICEFLATIPDQGFVELAW